MKYRSRSDITAAILTVALDGAKKTRIMYNAWLSFPQLEEYMGVLMKSGLLAHNEEERIYKTTDKGREFIESYKKMNDMIDVKPTKVKTRKDRQEKLKQSVDSGTK